MKSGILYIVATPIGNLGDITLRALETLKSVDLIACEDTRVTAGLLKRYEINKPTISYHQHSKIGKIDLLIEKLQAGQKIAAVTDSGTPGISDPAGILVARAHAEGITVLPLPGASAVAAAVSVSGIVEKEYYFAGFLPKKKGRQTEFKRLCTLKVPVVIYESAMRLERTLADIQTYFGDKAEVFIAREISKIFEEYWGGSINFVISDLKNHQLKGEIVLIVK